jgi:glycosyltransferase involved in cell wall biosynthesis
MSAAPAPLPLVSVIVRTLGRGTLVRTLESIAAQTHRPLEIVLVDSAGRRIAMASHRDVPVRVVRGDHLGATAAANSGLEAARGDWIAFLDDDDEIAPEHLASLLATAQAGGTRAAYSQTQLVSEDDQPGRIFGGGPFSRAALLRSNYMAIHAVLFHRSFVDAGVRFDTTLPLFEDWDFWLQLSESADFAFTGRATALYRAASGQSGGGAGANLDRVQAINAHERLMRKWRGSPASGEISASGRAGRR